MWAGGVVGEKLSWLRSDVVVLAIAREDLAVDGRTWSLGGSVASS